MLSQQNKITYLGELMLWQGTSRLLRIKIGLFLQEINFKINQWQLTVPIAHDFVQQCPMGQYQY